MLIIRIILKVNKVKLFYFYLYLSLKSTLKMPNTINSFIRGGIFERRVVFEIVLYIFLSHRDNFCLCKSEAIHPYIYNRLCLLALRPCLTNLERIAEGLASHCLRGARLLPMYYRY